MALMLMPPIVAHASDYDTESLLDLEQRALDLELENIYLRQRAIDAELSRERAPLDIQGTFMPPPRTSLRPTVEESYMPPPEEPSRSMRPPWLQPVDPMIPMLPEDRARMHCLGPRDCYLNQTGREGF